MSSSPDVAGGYFVPFSPTKQQQQIESSMMILNHAAPPRTTKTTVLRASHHHGDPSYQEGSLEVPYTNKFGRARSSLIKYDTDDEDDDDQNTSNISWMKQTHIVACDGTVATVTSTAESIRKTTTNYEVIYNCNNHFQEQNQKSAPFATTGRRSIEKENKNGLNQALPCHANSINSARSTTSELAEF
jgi:hypothetical protein